MVLRFTIICTLVFLFTGCGSSKQEREPNNSFSSAVPVLPGQTIRGEISKLHDRDVFRLKITDKRKINRAIRLQLKHDHRSDLRIIIHKNGRRIKIIDDYCLSTGPTYGKLRPSGKMVMESMANLALYPGEYYFTVQSAPGGKGVFPAEYRLHFLDESRSEFTEIEPNDSTTTATTIEAGVSVEGYLSPMGNRSARGLRERDYYKLHISASNKTVIDVKVTGVPGTDLVLSVLDGRGALIRRNDSAGMHMGESISKLGIREAGDYYILVHSKKKVSGSHTAPYTLRVDVESYQKGQEMEPNDSIREANPADTGQKISGFFNRRGDRDVYSFKIPQPGRYIFSARLKDVTDVDSYIQVFDRNGNRLTSINLQKKGEAEYIANLPLTSSGYDQLFYVLVGARSGSNSDEPYELYLGLHEANLMGEFGNNNTRDKANPLHPGTGKKGFLYPQGDRDWFMLRLKENRQLRLSITGVNGVDFRMDLHNSRGRKLRGVDGSGMNEGESLITDIPGPGVYYVCVYSKKSHHANAREAYTLTAGLSAPRNLPSGKTVIAETNTNTSTITDRTNSSGGE